MTAQLPLLGAVPPPTQAGPRVARPQSQLRSLSGETDVAGPALKATGPSRFSRAEAHSATDPERLDLGPIFVQAVPLPSPPSEPLWGTASRKPFPTHWPLSRSPTDPLPLPHRCQGVSGTYGCPWVLDSEPWVGSWLLLQTSMWLRPLRKGDKTLTSRVAEGLGAGCGSSFLSQSGGLRFTGGRGLGGGPTADSAVPPPLPLLPGRLASTLVAWPAPRVSRSCPGSPPTASRSPLVWKGVR